MYNILNRAIALIIIILFLPLFLIISLIIIFDDGLPFIYVQKRNGANDTTFNFLKFRTMKKKTPELASHLLNNPENYFTRSGHFLRKSSLDEIPQLLNVLKGEMNFVGPRPSLYNQKNLINLRKINGVNKIKPGITGWAQINGRDRIKSKRKVELDTFYLKNRSLGLDLKIILLTFFRIFSSKDVSH
tara:strand:+ start:19559 stop:20119 length:561 start_codon:yes stop_codon:yes gene_type:complete